MAEASEHIADVEIAVASDAHVQSRVVYLGHNVSRTMHEYFGKRAGWTVVTEVKASPDDDVRDTETVVPAPPSYHLYWADHTFDKKVLVEAHNNRNVRINHFNRLGINQMVNKAELAMNIKRFKMNYKGAYAFLPQSFCLPKQAKEFESAVKNIVKKQSTLETKANSAIDVVDMSWQTTPMKKAKWIVKPVGQNRGVGIYIFNEYAKLKYTDPVIVQRYISNPWLLAGYKFDFRLYVLVTSFWPLKCYIHKRGMVRFGTQAYVPADFGNLYGHLTNTSVNQHSDEYEQDKSVIGKGSKWTCAQLWDHLKKVNHSTTQETIWSDLKEVILLTLLVCVGRVHQNNGAFELFGFDLMLDSKCKAWLLEVNRSPAMRISIEADRQIKPFVCNDMFNLVGIDTLGSHEENSLIDPRTVEAKENIGEFDQIFPFNDACVEANASIADVPFSPADRNPPTKYVSRYTRAIIKEVVAAHNARG